MSAIAHNRGQRALRGVRPLRVALAYSGGLDTSVIITWLKEKYHCSVVAFCADLGQGEDLGEVAKKAKRTGADKVLSLIHI